MVSACRHRTLLSVSVGTAFLLFLAAGVVLPLFSAALPGSLSVPSVAEAADRPITITWWINPWRIRPPNLPADKAPTSEDFPKWISEEFMKLHPNVTVKYEVVPNAGFDEKVTAAILAGNPPDVIKGFKKQWAQRGLLEPIDEYLTPEDLADYYDYALAEGEVGGRHYLFPWNNSNNGMGSTMLLNPARFAERGVAMPALPDRSWTVDEFLATAMKLSYDVNGDGINDFYALGLHAKPDLHNSMAWLHVFGARLFNADETAFAINSPEAARGLQFMNDLIDKYKVAPPGAEGMGVYDVIGMFHQKKTAIGYGGPYEIGRIDRYFKEGRIPEVFQVHIAQWPYLPEVGPVAFHTSGGFAVFRQRDAEKKKMVMEFARFLTNKENTALLKSLLYVTARKSVNEGLYDDTPWAAEVAVFLKAIQNGIPYFGSADIDITPVQDHLTALFEASFAKTRTPEQALADFVNTATPILFRK